MEEEKEPQVLTPGTQSAQFAERFDRWLQNLRQQQLRLFSSCTSRVGHIENDTETDIDTDNAKAIETIVQPDSKLDSPQPEPETAIDVSKPI